MPIVMLTAAAVLLCTATSFGLGCNCVRARPWFPSRAHWSDHDHDHDHDNALDPAANTDEIAAHHVHVVAIVPPVDSLPWIPGRTVLCEFAYFSIDQGCIYRLERIPKAFCLLKYSRGSARAVIIVFQVSLARLQWHLRMRCSAPAASRSVARLLLAIIIAAAPLRSLAGPGGDGHTHGDEVVPTRVGGLAARLDGGRAL